MSKRTFYIYIICILLSCNFLNLLAHHDNIPTLRKINSDKYISQELNVISRSH